MATGNLLERDLPGSCKNSLKAKVLAASDAAGAFCLSLINLYPDSKWGAFAGRYPEIVDFGVLEKYRRHGIGSKLMDIVEQLAAGYSDTVYLGVGLVLYFSKKLR